MLLLLLSILFFLPLNSKATPIYNTHLCVSNTTTYTPNSTFQSNLHLTLSSLSSHANQTNTTSYGYANATAGRVSPDMAYGHYLCRGDVTADVCRDCVTTALTEITTRCPGRKDAMIWYDDCFIRYSNVSFLSTMNEWPWMFMWNPGNVTEVPRFQQVLGDTMNDLANLASNDLPNDEFVRGFATQEANFTSLQTLHGLVQCTPDLSGAQLPNCCEGRQGARVLIPSCFIRYELYPFYRRLASPAPPPSPVPTPTEPGGGNSSSTTIIAIIPPIVVALVLFALGYSYLVKKAKKNYNAVQQDNVGNDDITMVQSLQYALATIEAATNNFSDDNKIGEGGFGMVYKLRKHQNAVESMCAN